MRIAIGQLWQETNTFNPLPTTRADFEAMGVYRGQELIDKLETVNEPGGFIQAVRQWPEAPQLIGLVRFGAWPSGPATRETIAGIFDEMLDALRRALPVDAVAMPPLAIGRGGPFTLVEVNRLPYSGRAIVLLYDTRPIRFCCSSTWKSIDGRKLS